MNQRTIGVAIWAVSAILATAWLVEAFTVGRGFISTYLAPFAIVGNLIGAALVQRSVAKVAQTKIDGNAQTKP